MWGYVHEHMCVGAQATFTCDSSTCTCSGAGQHHDKRVSCMVENIIHKGGSSALLRDDERKLLITNVCHANRGWCVGKHTEHACWGLNPHCKLN